MLKNRAPAGISTEYIDNGLYVIYKTNSPEKKRLCKPYYNMPTFSLFSQSATEDIYLDIFTFKNIGNINEINNSDEYVVYYVDQKILEELNIDIILKKWFFISGEPQDAFVRRKDLKNNLEEIIRRV